MELVKKNIYYFLTFLSFVFIHTISFFGHIVSMVGRYI